MAAGLVWRCFVGAVDGGVGCVRRFAVVRRLSRQCDCGSAVVAFGVIVVDRLSRGCGWFGSMW